MEEAVRTVQRYEQEFQLPVRRFEGKFHTSVIALRSELDLWVKQRTMIAPVAGEENERPIEILSAVQKSIADSVELRNENRALLKRHASAIHDLTSSIRVLSTLLEGEKIPRVSIRLSAD